MNELEFWTAFGLAVNGGEVQFVLCCDIVQEFLGHIWAAPLQISED